MNRNCADKKAIYIWECVWMPWIGCLNLFTLIKSTKPLHTTVYLIYLQRSRYKFQTFLSASVLKLTSHKIRVGFKTLHPTTFFSSTVYKCVNDWICIFDRTFFNALDMRHNWTRCKSRFSWCICRWDCVDTITCVNLPQPALCPDRQADSGILGNRLHVTGGTDLLTFQQLPPKAMPYNIYSQSASSKECLWCSLLHY